jgi:ABC-type sugar transport system ATPase subunit
MTIMDNLAVAQLGRFTDALGNIRERAVAAAAEEMAGQVRVKATGVDQIVATLSGGNQQKVLLGRWLQLEPKVLIVDEPTVGVDVSAREEIYRLLRQRAEQGTAVIFISSELKELIQNTDRIVTMHDGRLTGSFPADSADESELMIAIAGGGERP